MILLDHMLIPLKVDGVNEKLFTNFDFQRGATLIFKEVSLSLSHKPFDFQSYFRRWQLAQYLFEFQRLYRYTISTTSNVETKTVFNIYYHNQFIKGEDESG